MEKFLKSINICQSYGQKYRGPFFDSQCRIDSDKFSQTCCSACPRLLVISLSRRRRVIVYTLVDLSSSNISLTAIRLVLNICILVQYVWTTGAALAAKARPLRTDLSIASGNFILEFPSINSRSRLFSRWRMRASPRGLWSRRQVWLPRMRQRDACWAGEVSLQVSPITSLRDGSPVTRYLYIDLWFGQLCYSCS